MARQLSRSHCILHFRSYAFHSVLFFHGWMGWMDGFWVGLSTLNFVKQGSICSWLVLTSVFLLLYQTSHSTKEKGYLFHVFEGLWQNGNIWSPRSEKGLLIHLSLTIALPPCCVFNLQWIFFLVCIILSSTYSYSIPSGFSDLNSALIGLIL